MNTILVVDDSLMMRRMLGAMLAKLGFRVVLAASDTEAVEIYRLNDSISVALLDVQMAGDLSGYQTFLALREINSDLPCCFMSGSVGADNVELPEPVFRKPFRDWDELAGHLSRIACQNHV